MEKKLTVTIAELLASTTNELETHGYQRRDIDLAETWFTTNVRIFEDDYGIVDLTPELAHY